MRVVGFMVCGPNEKYLTKTLDTFKRLCDDVVIATNNADEKTKQTIKEYGFWQYEDNREWGINQPLIKTDLLARIAKLRPDVILPLDADEVYDATYTRERVEEYSRKHPACYFYIVNHWNTEDRHRKSLGFWNIRQFNFLPQLGMEYQRKNLHCGLGPPWAYHLGSYVPHYIHHYGLMDPEARKRKVARYEKYDPSAKWKDKAYYEALKTETIGSSFVEEEMLAKLQEEVSKMGNQNKQMFQRNKQDKFVYVRRLADDKRLDMRESEWKETEKTQPGKFLYLGPVDDPMTDHRELEPPKLSEDIYQCPLCGKVVKTAAALGKHKSTHA